MVPTRPKKSVVFRRLGIRGCFRSSCLAVTTFGPFKRIELSTSIIITLDLYGWDVLTLSEKIVKADIFIKLC